jgi:hypothetical protein
VSAQARHTKKPRQCIDKLAYNPLPCRKSLRIATTPRHSMVEETCSLMEGSGSKRNTSNSSSDNPSSESNNPSLESKRTNNKVRTQTKVRDAQAASSTAKKMPKLTPSKQMPTKSPKQVGSPHKPQHCVS